MATFPRINTTQQVNYIAKRVTYSDTGIDTGVLEMPASLPPNACILRTFVDVETAFAATTTNVLTVGTVSGTANDIVTGGDVNETTAVPQSVVGPGMLSASAEKKIYIKFTGAGTANTAGVAVIVVEYLSLGQP
jgi:hypothetical protein